MAVSGLCTMQRTAGRWLIVAVGVEGRLIQHCSVRCSLGGQGTSTDTATVSWTPISALTTYSPRMTAGWSKPGGITKVTTGPATAISTIFGSPTQTSPRLHPC